MNKPFRVSALGSMHPHLLYDHGGSPVYTLEEAIETAEQLYGDRWTEVYNGEVGEERENCGKI